MAATWQYTKAMVRGVPDSFAEAALRMKEPGEAINLTLAKQQWAAYVETLKKLGLQVVEVPVDNDYPDCVFIEDAAVVCGKTAFVTRPGHHSRRGETIGVKKALEKLDLDVVEMVEPGELDGGDVMFTGKEFFVGLSSRTNKEGVKMFKKAFSEYPVFAIHVSDGLHLKSMMSMAGPNLIAIGQSSAAESVWKEIEANAAHHYNKLSLPEDKAANCLYINGVLVHSVACNIPKSISILQSLNCRRIELNISELSKADGCLTCSSLLIV